MQISERHQVVPPDEVRRRHAEVLDASQIAALDLVFGLRVCAQGMNRLVARWLGPDALRPGRFQVLVVLWSADGPLPQHDIVKRLEVTRATLSELIAGLQKDGLVAVAPDPADRRQLLVSLTPVGLDTIKRLVNSTTTKLRKSLAKFSDEELISLTGRLGMLASAVSAVSDDS